MKLVAILLEDGDNPLWEHINPGTVTRIGPVDTRFTAQKSFVQFMGGGALQTMHTLDELRDLINKGLEDSDAGNGRVHGAEHAATAVPTTGAGPGWDALPDADGPGERG